MHFHPTASLGFSPQDREQLQNAVSSCVIKQSPEGPEYKSESISPQSSVVSDNIPPQLSDLEAEGLGAKWDLCYLSKAAQDLPNWENAVTMLGWGKDIQFLLENTPLSYLATSSPTGVPELSLMFFTYDPDTHIIAFNTPKGRKVNNIMANDRVAMLFHNFEGKAATNSLFAGVKAQSFTLYGSASVMNGGAKKASDGDYDKAFKGGNKVKVTLHVDEVLVVNQSGHAFRFNRNECPEGRKY